MRSTSSRRGHDIRQANIGAERIGSYALSPGPPLVVVAGPTLTSSSSSDPRRTADPRRLGLILRGSPFPLVSYGPGMVLRGLIRAAVVALAAVGSRAGALAVDSSRVLARHRREMELEELLEDGRVLCASTSSTGRRPERRSCASCVTGSRSSSGRVCASSASRATRTGRTGPGRTCSTPTCRSSPIGTARSRSASAQRGCGAGWRACRGGARSSSTRTVRCSDRGGTRTRRCPTSTRRWQPRGHCGTSGRPVPRRRAARHSPAVFQTDRFLGYGEPRDGRVTPGDHLQTAYALWLPGHQLARGAELARSLQLPAGDRAQVNFSGWPFATVYGPLQALLGTVAGWNVFVLLTYVGAAPDRALAACARARARARARRWTRVRARPLPGGAVDRPSARADLDAAPLALYGVERRRTWLAAAALASIPALGPGAPRARRDPIRSRLRARPAAGGRRRGRGQSAVAAGILVWAVSLRDTVERPYRSSATRRRSATSSRATRASSSASSTSAGYALLAAAAGRGCLCFRTQSLPGAGSPSCSGWAPSSRACSRSGRTCLDTASSGGTRPCTRPGCRSGCCRSPASASPRSQPPRWLVFLKHKLAGRGASRRDRGPRRRRRPLGAALRPARRGRGQHPLRPGGRRSAGTAARAACTAARRIRRQRLPLLRDAGAARTSARLRDLGSAGGVPGRESCPRAPARWVTVVVRYRDGVPRMVRKR